jgi:hypothetical protein
MLQSGEHFQLGRLIKIEFLSSPIVQGIFSLYAYTLMVDLFSSQHLMPSRLARATEQFVVDIAYLYYLAFCTL